MSLQDKGTLHTAFYLESIWYLSVYTGFIINIEIMLDLHWSRWSDFYPCCVISTLQTLVRLVASFLCFCELSFHDRSLEGLSRCGCWLAENARGWNVCLKEFLYMQTKSVCHLFKLAEMNVIENVRVSTHFPDVASLHLSYLSWREWPEVQIGQCCLL